MANDASQSLKNHARYDPLFHFFMAPLALFAVIAAVVRLYRHMDGTSTLLLGLAVLIFLTIFKMRTYSLKVQDRVIRLEERLRLAQLGMTPVEIEKLSERQLIALRFASDGEAPALATKAAAQNLGSKQIKEAIQTWRADWFRV
jgi:hypothetical protein